MKFAYYPGCTAKSMAIEYHESVEETSRYLEIGLEEIPDWNYCGASSGHVMNDELAFSSRQESRVSRKNVFRYGYDLSFLFTSP